MSINQKLKERNSGQCELCNAEEPVHEYTVSPKSDDNMAHQVALCDTCFTALDSKEAGFHWRCLEGSIWSVDPSVQALSYRILQNYKAESWAENLLNSVDLDENTIQWALSALEVAEMHKDAYGNALQNGDNVVLIQALDVKGTNFTASKGTVVKRIKLVHDNVEHIEGKINEQSIVILCKYVKKN
jgi:protein PhnA